MSEEQRSAQLGDELVRRDMITREELEKAQKREEQTGTPWYRYLLQVGKVPFDVVGDVLTHEFHSEQVRKEHDSLGRALVEIKAITEAQLKEALAEQKRTGRLLGNILEKRGFITPVVKAKALARQNGLEFSELDKTPSAKSALEAVPHNLATKYQIIPIKIEGDKVTVLITEPQVRDSLGSLGVILNKRIYPVMTTSDNLKEEIKKRYSSAKQSLSAEPARPAPEQPAKSAAGAKAKTKAAEPAKAKEPAPKGKTTAAQKEEAKAVSTEATSNKVNRFEDIVREAQGAPVVKLVSTIIEGAVNSGATDIHMDPQEPEMRVRYRIDGVLHDVMSIAPEIEAAVISRIKILADLDITETRRPQDGHISLEVGDDEFDVRVATLPTYLGERIVMRLLDQTSVLAGIKDLGLDPDGEKILLEMLKQPYGMILVTGPTGSGKTTTLYASLNQKNVLTDSIVTIEDPVEYQLSGINQVQIDPDIDVTFASTLRASLRQDIDVLLVGEIRDADTARIAVRAAMTGHLVFSTLHTNDAPEAISTLRNMGVPSYLIASALTAVIAQRLVRKICPHCKTSFVPPKPLLKSIRLPETTKKLYKGKGCDQCYHTGSKGRTAIFEILEITPEIRRMIAADDPIEKITKAAKLKTMADSCRNKVKEGIVTAEEFLRVIRT
ncbi:MAG: hypothetical protein AMXMBFR84_27200 [Candidatus Hydrogenedentota bacterium]